jgi:ABC-type multidrug transport system fused ATPase/permease subunit
VDQALHLTSPLAIVTGEVRSVVDAVVFCVPAPLLLSPSSAGGAVTSGRSSGSRIGKKSISLQASRSRTPRLSHAFPSLLATGKTKTGNEGEIVSEIASITTSTSDVAPTTQRLKKHVLSLVNACVVSSDIWDSCWDALFDSQALLYLYTSTDGQLVSSFIKLFLDMRNKVTPLVVDMQSISSGDSSNSRRSIELVMLLDGIKMCLEIDLDDIDDTRIF